eukprot:GFYU01003183.1.p1 GENE.GFYU01003183.1~~GFYU01003183.1.p1  ORF type:complete len:615 (+),score=173.33 GFYU01003183.1:168-2012(+)
MDEKQLELQSVIGFSGDVPGGLCVHPDGRHIIYPLGSTIVIKDLENPEEKSFLTGHSDAISCTTISKDGRYLASGQITYMGFQADVIIWDLQQRCLVRRLALHKVKVQALSFSHDGTYLASLGGQDDNNLVIWHVESGKAICGSPAANEPALTVCFFNHSENFLITGGQYNLRVWHFDRQARKVRPMDCHTGQQKRIVQCIKIDENDEYAYCGTSTGDVLEISLSAKLFKSIGPVKSKFSLGVKDIQITETGQLLIGAGDGTIAVLSRQGLKIISSTQVYGGVTSITNPAHLGGNFYVGTSKSNTYFVSHDLRAELRSTCHPEAINDVAFPQNYSEVFATCSVGDIRIWHARNSTELLRIQVHNLVCNCVTFNPDGSAIVSGWSDGKVRAFGPQSGKLLYVINDAHPKGVTAVSCTNDGTRLVTGGAGGEVRVWTIGRQSQQMIASMKEHKGAINSIRVRQNDSEAVSASSDGSCIVWDLRRFVRNTSLFASTFFKSIVYHPEESQLLTTGTDRKITYWDTFDGSAIRIVDGSEEAEVNSLDITDNGKMFVSGGGDKLVRVWEYEMGIAYHVGLGHSGVITRLKISPDSQTIVSVGDEGGVFIWKFPTDHQMHS